MKFVSLFAGIGGLDLGLERAGWECVAQVENDPWCTKILEKHWPTIPKWSDIHELDPADLPDTDAVVGGFPCQPVSYAGRRKAQDDPRWLWPEFLRIVRMVRPRIVLVENVPGLLTAGLGDVLAGLAGAGYDTEWASVPAAAVGAPHLRWRVFIVAYSDTFGWDGWAGEQWPGRRGEPQNEGWWAVKSGVGGSADGVPKELDGTWEDGITRTAVNVQDRAARLRGLGNAVVPQVAEWVGRRINTSIGEHDECIR